VPAAYFPFTRHAIPVTIHVIAGTVPKIVISLVTAGHLFAELASVALKFRLWSLERAGKRDDRIRYHLTGLSQFVVAVGTHGDTNSQ
jgi:hypothetical protein